MEEELTIADKEVGVFFKCGHPK